MRTTVYNNILVQPSITVATRTNGTVNGTAVDLWINTTTTAWQNFGGAVVVVQTGTIGDGTHTVEVQESDDNSTFSAATELQGTEPVITSTNDNTLYEVGYHGTKRYVRVVIVTTDAIVGGTFGAVIALGKPRRRPVTHP